ncbi:nucleoside phosphorylase domain-containing protein [Xylaria venustula]|nr:nucleoside phosphorylase domain-containing protein [Xylaria venustula]
MTSSQRRIPIAEYTVGWICALPIEMAASIALLDELYIPPPQPPHDQNSYSFGRIGQHNVVLVCLPAGVTGATSAATVAAQFRSTFPSVQYGLLVGVGGGAPSAKNDIRLGDVVVSKPTGIFGGVVQYDFGKTIEKGAFKQTGSLNKPPRVLLSALASLETKCHLEGNKLTSDSLVIPDTYSELRSTAKYPGTEHDQLHKTECHHRKDPETCEVCDEPQYVDRPPRPHGDPVIHFGLIASANRVMRHGITWEKLRKELDVLCFEMEAAGLMDNFPCLVIRGISNYADVHKTKQWQPYAAVTAAACAKQILLLTPVILEEKVVVTADDTAQSTAWLSAFNGSSFQSMRNHRFSGRDTELALLDSCGLMPLSFGSLQGHGRSLYQNTRNTLDDTENSPKLTRLPGHSWRPMM